MLKNIEENPYQALVLANPDDILRYDDYLRLTRYTNDEQLPKARFDKWINESMNIIDALLQSQLLIHIDSQDAESPVIINKAVFNSKEATIWKSMFYLRKAITALIDFQNSKDATQSIFDSLKYKAEVDLGEGTINVDSFDPSTIFELIPHEVHLYLSKGHIYQLITIINPGYSSYVIEQLNKLVHYINDLEIYWKADQARQDANIEKNRQMILALEVRVTLLEEIAGIGGIEASPIIKTFDDDTITNTIYQFIDNDLSKREELGIYIKDLTDTALILNFDSAVYKQVVNVPILLNFNGMANPIQVIYDGINKISITIPQNFSLRGLVASSRTGFSLATYNLSFDANVASKITEDDDLSELYGLNQSTINNLLNQNQNDLANGNVDLPQLTLNGKVLKNIDNWVPVESFLNQKLLSEKFKKIYIRNAIFGINEIIEFPNKINDSDFDAFSNLIRLTSTKFISFEATQTFQAEAFWYIIDTQYIKTEINDLNLATGEVTKFGQDNAPIDIILGVVRDDYTEVKNGKKSNKR